MTSTHTTGTRYDDRDAAALDRAAHDACIQAAETGEPATVTYWATHSDPRDPGWTRRTYQPDGAHDDQPWDDGPVQQWAICTADDPET